MITRYRCVVLSALAIMTLVTSGCSVTDTAELQLEAKVIQHAQEYWDRNSGYREADIREGAFKTLRIGLSPVEVGNALGEIHARYVTPLQDRRYAETKIELEQLRNATALRMGPGDVTIVFDGDVVIDRLVAYDLPGHEALRAAATRDDVFRLLGQMVRPEARGLYTVMTDDPTADPLLLPASPKELERFGRFTTWETDFKDDEGYWGLRLRFVNSKLVQIKTRFSRLEPL